MLGNKGKQLGAMAGGMRRAIRKNPGMGALNDSEVNMLKKSMPRMPKKPMKAPMKAPMKKAPMRRSPIKKGPAKRMYA